MDKVDLKALRESKGLSLKDIFKKTRISLNNLGAIEQGDFASLPPAVYTRKFMKEYAEAIGFDSQVILQDYEAYLSAQKPTVTAEEDYPPISRRYLQKKHYLPLIAAVLSGVIIYSLILYYEDPSRHEVKQNTETISPLTAGSAAPSEQTEVTAAAKKDDVPPPEVKEKAAALSGYDLVIEAQELTWIRIRSDRNPPYQLLMKPGEKLERLAAEYFIIHIGNAGGVNLVFQGKPLGSLGQSGEVVHLRLP